MPDDSRRFVYPVLIVARVGYGFLHDLPTAGLPWAAVWVAVVGGRMLFAWEATHGGAQDIARFSVPHEITGADARTAAFVVMALAMVLARTAVMAVRSRQVLVAQPA